MIKKINFKPEKAYIIIDKLMKFEPKKYSLIINKKWYKCFQYDLDKLSDIFIYIKFEDLSNNEIYKIISFNVNKDNLKYKNFI